MPAPKKFTPGPTTAQSYSPGSTSSRVKGRHAVVPPRPKPGLATDDEVEVTVEEVSVVMRGPSKYEQRSMNAHVDPTIAIDIDALDDVEEPVEVVAPAPAPRVVFGRWRTESDLDGKHYHRKDSRRI